MAVLKVKDPATGLWIDIAGIGPQGVSSIMVGDFGDITTPADLPPSGLIPIDFDGPGVPAVAYQMELRQSLYYDKPSDPTLNGHLFQYVGTGVEPSGWLDIKEIQGPVGPLGPVGPVGPTGPPGEMTQAASDSRYFNVSGDTVNGASTFNGTTTFTDRVTFTAQAAFNNFDLVISPAGSGIQFAGGSRIYSSNSGVIRLTTTTGGAQPQISGTDFSNPRDIIDTVNGDARYMPLTARAAYDATFDDFRSRIELLETRIAQMEGGA